MKLLIEAKTAEEVFGADCTEIKLKGVFHKLALMVHPDKNTSPEAAQAFQKLKDLYEYAVTLFKEGKYGKNIPFSGKVDVVREKYFDLKGGRISKVEPFDGGTLTNVFTGYFNGKKVIIKMAKNSKDNDLLMQEEKAIRRIEKFAEESSVEDHKKIFQNHFPVFVTSFLYDQRRCNVFEYVENVITLREATKHAIDNRTIVWIWKRILAGLILLQESKVIHNALTMDNILIDPANHNAIIIDFCYSTFDKPKLIDSTHRDFYPPEVFEKKSLDTSADIYMLGKVINKTIQEKLLKRFDNLLRACILKHNRIGDATEVYTDVDKIAFELFGKPKFHPFPPLK